MIYLKKDEYLLQLENDFMYSYVKDVFKSLKKVQTKIEVNCCFFADIDLIVVNRINKSYLKEILDGYLQLNKKQRKEQRKIVVDSLINIKNKLFLIMEETDERIIHNMKKQINLSNGMLASL